MILTDIVTHFIVETVKHGSKLIKINL